MANILSQEELDALLTADDAAARDACTAQVVAEERPILDPVFTCLTENGCFDPLDGTPQGIQASVNCASQFCSPEIRPCLGEQDPPAGVGTDCDGVCEQGACGLSCESRRLGPRCDEDPFVNEAESCARACDYLGACSQYERYCSGAQAAACVPDLCRELCEAEETRALIVSNLCNVSSCAEVVGTALLFESYRQYCLGF